MSLLRELTTKNIGRTKVFHYQPSVYPVHAAVRRRVQFTTGSTEKSQKVLCTLCILWK